MFYKPDSTNFREILPGIFMKALTFGDNSLLCEFHLKRGSIVPLHQHSQEQTGYLVTGLMRFSGDDGDFNVEPGSSWCFKGGVAHAANILEDSVLIEVFSPVRQDYLP